MQSTPIVFMALLCVMASGKADDLSRYFTYYPFALGNFSLDREATAPLDGQSVTLKGTFIYAGQLVKQRVLDLVAEPIESTGEVERQGELLILLADPATYRRL